MQSLTFIYEYECSGPAHVAKTDLLCSFNSLPHVVSEEVQCCLARSKLAQHWEGGEITQSNMISKYNVTEAIRSIASRPEMV